MGKSESVEPASGGPDAPKSSLLIGSQSLQLVAWSKLCVMPLASDSSLKEGSTG
jgi:hypothetical protein